MFVRSGFLFPKLKLPLRGKYFEAVRKFTEGAEGQVLVLQTMFQRIGKGTCALQNMRIVSKRIK